MRQGEPDAAELAEAGVAGVGEAAGDAEVGDGVSVEEEVVAAGADDEADQGEDEGGEGYAGMVSSRVAGRMRSGSARGCQRERRAGLKFGLVTVLVVGLGIGVYAYGMA